MVNVGILSATICVPFGAETVENDPCTVGTTRNYTAGTGNRQNTSAQAKELELELIQTQMTQKPMLRAEVYARALRASQNRKEDSV